ncbi:MAG: sigma-70 family RNA polymerase sigma factor [Phycisphaeraceae bacterium]|nr:sigma-70 family RNA polymerase sigma factor [Phycisphaeraceae bacterium]
MPDSAPPSSPNPPPSGREVFEILAREHADMLAAYLRTLVYAPDVIDDLFQETMLVAWRRLQDFDKSRPFGPWLRGIAANLVLEHRRRSARGVMCCDPEVLEAIDRRFTDLSRFAGDSFRDRAGRLRHCLARLPDKLREVVELAYARGLLLKQIAESLSASEEAVKKRVQRARESLVLCLSTTGGDA